MVDYKVILDEFHIMLDEHWPYDWGAARYGCVDCSGAFVYAYNKHKLDIAHGSNAIARKYVVKLIPYSEAKIEAGMIALKARKPGEKGYALPEKYKNDPDQNDYYHIGLVDEDRKTVLNAQGTATGFVRSPITQNWNYVAYAKDLIYLKEDNPVETKQATVVAKTGSSVNMRAGASTSSLLIDRVPIGSKVMVMQDHGEWMQIAYGTKTGWMMANYIDYDDAPDETKDEDLMELVRAARDILDKVLKGA